MILYQYPGADGLSSISPPCMKVEMALKRLEVEYRVENLVSPSRARRVSVTGRLPVLELDGERIPDSIVILDRLERKFPTASLWPSDPVRRLQDRLWDHFGTDSMYWLGFYLRWVHPEFAPASRQALFGRLPWIARAALRVRFLPRQRKRAMLHGVGGKSPAMIRAEMERGFEMLVAGLQGGPFLQARATPGRGDLACVALLAQAGFRRTLTETMEQIRSRPALTDYVRGVLESCRMRVPAWLAA